MDSTQIIKNLSNRVHPINLPATCSGIPNMIEGYRSLQQLMQQGTVRQVYINGYPLYQLTHA